MKRALLIPAVPVCIIGFCISLFALSAVTEYWVQSCLKECMKGNPSHKDCNENSIRFIGDEYVRARKGEPYWKSDAGKSFSHGFQAADHRMGELKQLCPGAAGSLKRNP